MKQLLEPNLPPDTELALETSKKEDTLELQDDFYTITWLTIYKYYMDKEIQEDKRRNNGVQTIYTDEVRYNSLANELPKVSPVSPAKNLSCCIFIFMLQIGIIYLLFSGEQKQLE